VRCSLRTGTGVIPEFSIPKGTLRVGWLDANHPIAITIVLTPRMPVPAKPIAALGHDHRVVSARRRSPATPLTHAECSRRHGAGDRAVSLVESFAEAFGLTIVETAQHRRNIQICGRAADVERAFKTRFEELDLSGSRFFAPAVPPSIPEEWIGVVEAVLGLQNSPSAEPRRRSMVHGRGTPVPLGVLARAYAFPQDFDGSGETIALIEFGGGFHSEDIERFCSRMGFAAPRITVVEIGHNKLHYTLYSPGFI